LAVLPGEGGKPSRGRLDAFVSPDGKTIALPGGQNEQWLWVYRPAGWDCRESHLGAMVFPQMWLTAGAIVAAVLVLFGNAARRGEGQAGSLVVLGVTAPIAAYGLVCVCLGDTRHALWFAPAGLLVVCSIGLALGSRFWRVASLWSFAASLSYVLWVAYRVWRAGPKGLTLYPLLDRYYDVPHLPVLIGLVCGAGLLGLGLVTVARSPRQ
jgi:hypothetical protein